MLFYVVSCFLFPIVVFRKKERHGHVGTHERIGPAPEHMWMLAPLLALGELRESFCLLFMDIIHGYMYNIYEPKKTKSFFGGLALAFWVALNSHWGKS